jgi:N-acetylmuramoyl-L-alanine amidase
MGRTRIPLNQLARLDQRCNEVNKLYHKNKRKGAKKQTVVCVHVDSRSPQRRQDVFFYYYEESQRGKALAYNLQNTFRTKYKKYRPNRDYRGTVSSRNLYVLRNTDAPAVYVELANIKNSYDRQRIMPYANRQALANWLFEGLIKD